MINTRVPGGFGGGGEMQNGQAIVILKHWDDREQTTDEVVEQVGAATWRRSPACARCRTCARAWCAAADSRCRWCSAGPDYAQLVEWRDRLQARFEANPQLTGVDSDYKETRPQLRVVIDHDRAADLGVAVGDIGNTLQTMLGSSRATTFVDEGKEYDVLVQAERTRPLEHRRT